MKGLLLACTLFLTMTCAQAASMRWLAVALSPEQLTQISGKPAEAAKILNRSKGEAVFDLDRSWQGLHYLLNETAWEPRSVAGQAVLGGATIFPDVGGGPALLITADRVKLIAAALARLSPSELSTHYDGAAMDQLKIYPQDWQKQGPAGREALLGSLLKLSDFYQRAAERGEALLLTIQ